MATLLEDVRFAARILRKNAGFTTVADLGATNESIFALRDAVRERAEVDMWIRRIELQLDVPPSHYEPGARDTGQRSTTGANAARIASRMPGTARIVPVETTGFDGATRIASAAAIASITPGAGTASSMPRSTNRRGGREAR